MSDTYCLTCGVKNCYKLSWCTRIQLEAAEEKPKQAPKRVRHSATPPTAQKRNNRQYYR